MLVSYKGNMNTAKYPHFGIFRNVKKLRKS
nr:MAG TPA: hypothetical protein [Caudoviricetes sp.]